jgi:serine/threonine-protein kinase
MDHPPPKLVKLLEDLGLATAGQVASIGGRARRLARQLPLLESVWVDALVQARRLTAWQAAEIRAGRGEQLRVGSFVLEQPLDWPDFGAAYRARQIDSRAVVRLVVWAAKPGQPDPLGRLESLASRAPELSTPGVSPIVAAGAAGDLRYVASRWLLGISAAEWMIHHGRVAPLAVLEIARQMTAALAALERAGVCHGDLSPRGLLLTDAGQAVLLQPGVRAIVRPVEGIAYADLQPAAYDYLAPERGAGSPATPSADLYAAACVWWHLLAGRAPRSGGSSLAKLHAAQSGRLPEIRQLVQRIPQPLAEAIACCTAAVVDARPPSFVRLVSLLGPSDRAGKASLRRCLSGELWNPTSFDPFPANRRPNRLRGVLPAGLAALLVVVATVATLAWQGVVVLKGRPELPSVATGPAATSSTASKLPAVAAASGPGTPVDAGPIAAETLALTAGTRVGASDGRRVQLRVPAAGLRVPVDNVSFENVDFLWSASPAVPPAEAAMLRLHAGRAEFRGCTFRVAAGPHVPVAIRWAHPAEDAHSTLSLPSGKLRLGDSVFESVDAAVECRTRGPTAIECSNVLQVNGGPLVRAWHWPTAEESLRVTLQRATLRNTGGVLECHYEKVAAAPGPLVVQAVQSGLFPGRGKALITLAGSESPAPLIEVIQWTGQGSLMGIEAPVAMWLPPQGAATPVDDSRLAISGVARSEVEFAGPAEAGPAASQILGWQGPLRSPDPPGADIPRLPIASPSRKRS